MSSRKKPIQTTRGPKATRRTAEQQRAHDWMLADLKKSGLDADDAEALGCRAYTAVESRSLRLSREGQGYKLPYFDAEGCELPMFRYRFSETTAESGFLKGQKLSKYEQPCDTDPEIYLSQIGGVDWPTIKGDARTPLCIVEGEKKQSCATKHLMQTIGLGGVWSFGQKRKGYQLLPALAEFDWVGRDVYICYDSDAVTNPDVVTAEGRLAEQLVDRGALVRVVRLPQNGSSKVGIYVALFGCAGVRRGKESAISMHV